MHLKQNPHLHTPSSWRPARVTVVRMALGSAALLSLVTGCGGIIQFEGKKAFQISADGPTPPPPPKAEAPKPPKRVTIQRDKIEIGEKIQFELNSAVIKSESDSLLAEIAEVMNDNAFIKKIRIEGHASADGDDAKNLKLSKERAASVLKHLVDKGKVAAGRLESEGYGETKPIADNKSEEGRVKNRRVEFNILEQDLTAIVSAEEAVRIAKEHAEKAKEEAAKAAVIATPAPEDKPGHVKRPARRGTKPEPKKEQKP